MWTQRSCHCERITKDEKFWDEMMRKACRFFRVGFLPELDAPPTVVAVNISGGMSAAGQTVPLTSKLGDVVDFCKYFTIIIIWRL